LLLPLPKQNIPFSRHSFLQRELFGYTVVICFITGLSLVSSEGWHQSSSPVEIVRFTWNSYPLIGPILLTIALLTFVYSTILGWSYYGEKAWEYFLVEKVQSFIEYSGL
jgi:AGCS family alanine or glycine:cation symporter